MKYFCVGCVARTSNVTEESVNTPNNVSNKTKHIDHKKCDTKNKSFLVTKRPEKLNTNNYNYKSCEEINIEESLSKRLKTEENMLRDNPYGDIVLWERPDEIPQSTLGNSANISGVNLDWKYSAMEGIW